MKDDKRDQIARLFYETSEALDRAAKHPMVLMGPAADLLKVLRAQQVMIQFLLAREGQGNGG